MTLVRIASADDVADIVRIHREAFPGFFLTSLGPRFLELMYREYMRHPCGIVLVACDASEAAVCGFVAGTTDPATFFRSLRQTRKWQFAWAAVPALLMRPWVVAERMWAALFYSGERPMELERSALLSSLGVTPESLGRGFGRLLVEAFCDAVRSRGGTSCYLTTDAARNDRVNRFYERCGMRRVASFRRPRGRDMNVYWRGTSAARESMEEK